MKAKVKETGQIVEVEYGINMVDCYASYYDKSTDKAYSPMELDLDYHCYSKGKKHKDIDWEQRRYEMMKDFAAACIANGNCGPSDDDIDGVAYMAKKYVDAIEKQLKPET